MALPPPDGQWEADVVLSDGGTVHVRPIRPSDAEAYRSFHAGLSPQSLYFRFFSPKPRLSDAEVERFTTVDMADRVALVAMLGDEIDRRRPLRPLGRQGRGRGGLHRRRRAPGPRPVDDPARAPGCHRPNAWHRPLHRRGAGRQPGHALGVRPGRVARQPGLRQRGGRRRLRHRPHARLPRTPWTAASSGPRAARSPVCSTPGPSPSSAPPTTRRRSVGCSCRTC